MDIKSGTVTVYKRLWEIESVLPNLPVSKSIQNKFSDAYLSAHEEILKAKGCNGWEIAHKTDYNLAWDADVLHSNCFEDKELTDVERINSPS